MKKFEDYFFFNEINRFVGSGGEILVKRQKIANSILTRMEEGDRLIGIGITHLVESLSRPPGPDSFHSFEAGINETCKMALRCFEVASKQKTKQGFSFNFSPISSKDYSSLLEEVSEGRVKIEANTIPKGTIILSFIDRAPNYTLKTIKNSPSENWLLATQGERHWNVGFGKKDDFWEAEFPSDRVGLLNHFSSINRLGVIKFGLSLLSGSNGAVKLNNVKNTHISGKVTEHHFSLTGYAVGTKGIDTPFPIGLRTEILFHPVRH